MCIRDRPLMSALATLVGNQLGLLHVGTHPEKLKMPPLLEHVTLGVPLVPVAHVVAALAC
eukprot:1955089-Alexandrium_andersonii.AAC.1